MSFLAQSIVIDSPNGKIEGLNVQSPDTDNLPKSPKTWPVLSFCRIEQRIDLGICDYKADVRQVNFLAISSSTAAMRLEDSHKKALKRQEINLLSDIELVLQADFYHEAAKNAPKRVLFQEHIAMANVNAQSLFEKNHGSTALADLKNNWQKFRSDYADPCFFDSEKLTIT